MSPSRNASGRQGRAGRWAETEDYRRAGGLERQRGRLFIVCEGKETEPLYFESAWKERQKQNQLDPVIVVRPGKAKTYPTAIVERAIKIKESSNWDEDLDQIWAVFDTEQAGTHPDLIRAIRLARENQVDLAVSNPSVEYWFLLHFENTNRPFQNTDQLCDVLRKYIPEYNKSKTGYLLIRDRMEIVLSRAKVFRGQSGQKWEDIPNPSTGLDNWFGRYSTRNHHNDDRWSRF